LALAILGKASNGDFMITGKWRRRFDIASWKAIARFFTESIAS
jgi:hypothetical protein